VRGVVEERQMRRDEAQRSLANSLAQAQTLLGPVLVRQCTETWAERVPRKDKEEGAEDRPAIRWHKKPITLRLAPQTLRLSGELRGEPRHRGLYQLNAYQAQGQLEAQWARLDSLNVPAGSETTASTVSCEAPRLAVALSDARGIRAVQVQINGQSWDAQPGSGLEATPQGFHVKLPEALLLAGHGAAPGAGPVALKASLTLDWMGTSSLSVAPVAEQVDVRWHSNWPHPSFGGHFLPSQRELGADGFAARWQLSALSSTAALQWSRGQGLCPTVRNAYPEASPGNEVDQPSASTGEPCVETFSVSLMDPVNPYVLSDRASKYGVLFILLTFVGVALLEVMKRLRVHPIQYLLVGAALAIFFLLLLSLSEHLGFAWAYLAAASACTLLLTGYGAFMLGGWRAGSAFGAALALLYGALYAVLQMEQTALLLGSLLLFAVLATVMISTRRMDWYALKSAGHEPPASHPS
jgi:inner membrane protein